LLPYLAIALLTSVHAGTYIDVYGRLPITTDLVSVAEFTVDIGPPVMTDYPSPMNIAYNATSATASNFRLYYNPHLSAEIHMLVITPQAPYALWLDYAIAGTGTDLINAGDTVTTFAAPPSSTISSTSSSSSSRHGTHTPEIVGGTGPFV
jgi:hypothetical protein